MSKEKIDYIFYKSLLDKLVHSLKEEYNNELISIVLYGSVARGTAKKESDIDLILVIRGLSYTAAINRFLLVEEKFKQSIEFISIKKAGYSPEIKPVIFSQKEASESRYIFLDVVEEGIIIYDKDDFFKKRLERIGKRLKELGSKRIFCKDNSWYWILVPDLRLGEVFEI